MLRDVLLIQKREIENRLEERYVERDVGERKLGHDLIKVVIGPRRAGKSFFAMQLIHRLGCFGYVNFDDERLVKIDDYDELVAALDSLYGNPKHLLLDEVQSTLLDGVPHRLHLLGALRLGLHTLPEPIGVHERDDRCNDDE